MKEALVDFCRKYRKYIVWGIVIYVLLILVFIALFMMNTSREPFVYQVF